MDHTVSGYFSDIITIIQEQFVIIIRRQFVIMMLMRPNIVKNCLTERRNAR
jgi:hypothetical protein